MHHTKQKRWQEVLWFLKTIRKRYSKDRSLYVVLDNMKLIRRTRSLNGAQPIRSNSYLLPNSSWMNRIECHFSPAKQFVISNSDLITNQSVGQCNNTFDGVIRTPPKRKS